MNLFISGNILWSEIIFLSDNTVVIPAYLSLVLAWYIFTHTFILKIYVSVFEVSVF